MLKVRYKHETAFSLLPESQALPTETYRGGRLTGVVEPTHGCYQSVGQTAQGQWIVDGRAMARCKGRSTRYKVRIEGNSS
jgi:hypothetical protein